MSDDQLIIQEGLFPQNNTATLFHRTSHVENIPKILIQYLKIIKCLEFKETPNYDLLINIFKDELKEA